jgi:hypothetical protein
MKIPFCYVALLAEGNAGGIFSSGGIISLYGFGVRSSIVKTTLCWRPRFYKTFVTPRIQEIIF